MKLSRLATLAAISTMLSVSNAQSEPLMQIDSKFKNGTRTMHFEGQDLSAEVSVAPTAMFDVTFKGLPCERLSLPVRVVDDVRRLIRHRGVLIVEAGIRQYPNYSQFVLIDLGACKVKAVFDAYGARISPDESKIAFVRFYPLHFTESPDDQYHVADVDELVARHDSQRPLEEVGRRLLVSRTDLRTSANAGVAPESAHRLLSELTWSPDSRAVAFVDAHGAASAGLVLAHVSGGAPVVKRYRVAAPLAAHSAYQVQLPSAEGVSLQIVQQRIKAGSARQAIGLGTPETVPQ